MNQTLISPPRSRSWTTIAAIAAAVVVIAGAAAAFVLIRDDGNEPQFTRDPARMDQFAVMNYSPIIYFERDSLFADDRWVWIDAFDCPVVDSTNPPVFAAREPMDGEPSFDEQVGHVNDGWREIVEDNWDNPRVGMLAANNVELGFRLPDGASDDEMFDFADNLEKFVNDHGPCQMTA